MTGKFSMSIDNKAVVYLYYFKGSADWYITEKDMEDEQLQAFRAG